MRRVWTLIVAASAGLGGGCGGDVSGSERGGGGSSSCPAGSEGCACYGNSTCDAGLTCASQLCVNLGTGGSPGQGGSPQGGVPQSGGSGATTGVGGGIIFFDASTGGSGGADSDPPIEPCDISKSLPNCTASTQVATMRTANLLILLDKSGSMGKPGLGSATSKWDSMKTALNSALNRSRTVINFGLDLFPSAEVAGTCTGEQCCQTPALADPLTVPVGPGVDTVPPIISALDATAPSGGTPMAGALARALDYYTTGDGFNLSGDKYVLLVTDGGPNCHVAAVPSCDMTTCTRNLDPDPTCNQSLNCCSTAALAVNCLDDGSVTTAINNLRAANIATIVVGIPGSENYAQYLNSFAQVGGKPQIGASSAYYAVAESAGVTGLADTLHAIAVDLVKGCVITYARPPDDPELVNVLVDCNLVPRSPATDGGDWSYWTLDTTANTITLGGPVCDFILDTGAQRIDYLFGCLPPPV